MVLKEGKKILINAQTAVAKHVTEIMNGKKFSYKTFGQEIESYVSESMEKVFRQAGQKSVKRAENKNAFPDLAVVFSDGTLAIDFKTGNHYKKKRGNWVSCNNSNNDLGTIKSWPGKIKKFGGENIFFVFVEYSINDSIHKLETVTIDVFYKFLDVNMNGVLKYRKKDGNLRPKNFNAPSKIKSFEEFNKLFEQTSILRAKSLISEHLETIPKKDRNSFLDSLKTD